MVKPCKVGIKNNKGYKAAMCLPLGEPTATSEGELDRLLPVEVREILWWNGVAGSLCVDLVDGDRCLGSPGQETLRSIPWR